MAIRDVVTISIEFVGDGTSTQFSFDLSKDAHALNNASMQNYFITDRKLSPPSDIRSESSGVTASLSGTVVTLNFTTAPPNTRGNVFLTLLF